MEAKKPMSAREAFSEDAPVPPAALEALAYMNRKDELIGQLEQALQEAQDELRAYEQADWVGRAQRAEGKVEAANRYIDHIPVRWQRDIRVARELIEEKGLTGEYEARLKDEDDAN